MNVRTRFCNVDNQFSNSIWGLGYTCALLVSEALKIEVVERLLDQKRNLCQMPAAEGRQLYDLHTKDCSSQTKRKQRYGLKLEKQTCEAGETVWLHAQHVGFESY